jgi:hypothetical protein
MHLEITCRQSRFFVPEGEFLVRFNGERLGEWVLDPKWRQYRIEIPASTVRSGMNSLELLWPLGHWQSAAALEEAASGQETGQLRELSPAFGDLWGLWLEQPL